jgi:hypothetical protein
MTQEDNVSIVLHNQTDLRPRSGLGISSFGLGAIGTLSFVLLTGYASVFNKTGSANATIGEGLVLVWTINLIGIGLGIAGVVHRSSRNTFPILGLVLNLGILTLGMTLMEIGLRMR